MGLTTTCALLLTRVANELEDTETVVCLGNPHTLVTYEDYTRKAAALDIEVPDTIRNHPDGELEVRAFFEAIGFPDFRVLDIDDYQGAGIVQNLSEDSLDDEHCGVADLVYDTGTLEHVYNLDSALKNIHRLLSDGGIAYHVNPTNGMLDHGFYQISPTFYHDYYRASGYNVIGAGIADTNPRSRYNVRVRDYDHDIYRTDGIEHVLTEHPRANIHYCAQKCPDSQHARAPVQSYWRSRHDDDDIEYSAELSFDIQVKKDQIEYYGGLVARRLGVLDTARRLHSMTSR
ncbi:methyltransferase domain-containing protein [Halobacterium jilantaiense]|uniref:Methyltransferase domain-containing protein n=1 Tax=Halobacterium jilantaiense TaxID=355548 RepID=A0A1I0MSM7_9EURY|nr:class I SAM-dependent methyltransferase [Halobacterium jilantaiense]SEV91659.1 hypothetical protein SAMN04487945_0338 [Halobacterium jilantaiense]